MPPLLEAFQQHKLLITKKKKKRKQGRGRREMYYFSTVYLIYLFDFLFVCFIRVNLGLRYFFTKGSDYS
jgi:hypothetical protein